MRWKTDLNSFIVDRSEMEIGIFQEDKTDN